MQQPYNADYFLRGKAVGVSNYTDYRWLEGPTMALAQRVIEVMRIEPGDSFLDFGCARGYLVKAMRQLCVQAWGHDISEWAIKNCDPDVRAFVSCNPDLAGGSFEHIWSKDCLEHIDEEELRFTLPRLIKLAQKSVLFIVPLTDEVDGPYLREEDNFDKTHVIRWPLDEWIGLAHDCCAKEGWCAQGSYHIDGLKPASADCPGSCGFITLRRI